MIAKVNLRKAKTMKRLSCKEKLQMQPKKFHQERYEAASVPQNTLCPVKKTQEKSLTCDLSITRGRYQVIYSQLGLAIHQNDHQARRRFVEWAQNEIAVVPDFHKRTLFSDEAHFWLTAYVNKQNCRIWSEANPQVYVETPLHPEKLTVWCALWAGGILLQKQ
ncbi:transposable element Tc3 transposase [Trichonephila clavipes]|nr:transposable element Tc3 transposase [Trichonephila clavipes]